MTDGAQAGSGLDTNAFITLRDIYGFVPQLFRLQQTIPAVLASEVNFVETIWAGTALSRLQKECILLLVAAARRNAYWTSVQYQILQLLGIPERQLDMIVADPAAAGLSPETSALLRFAVTLNRAENREQLRDSSRSEQLVLETIVVAAFARFLCVLANGLGAKPDFGAKSVPAVNQNLAASSPRFGSPDADARPAALHIYNDAPVPESIRQHFGSVPGLFHAQMAWPELVGSEARLLDSLFSSGLLTELQIRTILLSVSGRDRSSYGVALHADGLRRAAFDDAQIRAVLTGSAQQWLSVADQMLLDFTHTHSAEIDHPPDQDLEALRQAGFTEQQIAAAVVTIAFGKMLNSIADGLVVPPDFDVPHTLWTATENNPNPVSNEIRPTAQAEESDPDEEDVRRVQDGEIEAFEKLVERHGRRVYRTLVGLLGEEDEARDAMQDTFLKAFQHIGTFERRSKFSTWLVSIATNTGLQRIRERRYFDPIDDSGAESDEGFRPRQIRAWTEDPEALYSRSEMRSLVERGVKGLPAKYRVVVMLRDIEQLPIEDTALALGLGISAVKSRLLRGRLMLREALASHFVRTDDPAGAKGVSA